MTFQRHACLARHDACADLWGHRLKMQAKCVGADVFHPLVPDAILGRFALPLNPTLHNPRTLTIPQARRMEIADILIRHHLPLIEDDAYGFTPAHVPAPFATLAPDLTWHIVGLAKCIGAGLRLAHTVTPDARAGLALAQAQRAISVMPSPLSMALATRWIEDGTADSIRRSVRAETSARQSIVAEVLAGPSVAMNCGPA